MVEYYYGVYITKKSPLMKRLNQEEHLQKFLKMDFDSMAGAVNKAIAVSFKG